MTAAGDATADVDAREAPEEEEESDETIEAKDVAEGNALLFPPLAPLTAVVDGCSGMAGSGKILAKLDSTA